MGSNKRRNFLKSAAAVTAGLTMACDSEAEADAAAAAVTSPGGGKSSDGLAMPTLQLGPHTVSRLIVGSNPIHGYSHFNKLFNTHMTEWATTDRVCDMLERCEGQQINTWQFSHHDRAMRDLEAHRERGGKMQWILISHSEIEDDHKKIAEVVKRQPLAIVHHGGSAERKRREGQTGKIKDFLAAVRDSGVLVGLSTHDPEFLDQAEAEQWDVDFYMTALYYVSRTGDEWRKLLGTRPVGEIYVPEDPPRMCAAMRQARKPCLAYKLLAAGRLTNAPEQVEAAFQFALGNIKPNDGLIVGMYPRYTDQIGENAGLVRRICADQKV
jgi:hypothetical protein